MCVKQDARQNEAKILFALLTVLDHLLDGLKECLLYQEQGWRLFPTKSVCFANESGQVSQALLHIECVAACLSRRLLLLLGLLLVLSIGRLDGCR